MPLMADLLRAMLIVAGLAIAGIVHVAWLRTAASRRFVQPLDGGRCWRGRRLLGANKTLRGLMAMPPAAALAFIGIERLLAALAPDWHALLWPLTVTQWGLLGLACGAVFMLAELPNSFVKRQLDIAPGGLPAPGPGRFVGAAWDRLDSTLGVLLLLTVLPGVGASVGVWLSALVLGPLLHALFSLWLHRAGIKARAL